MGVFIEDLDTKKSSAFINDLDTSAFINDLSSPVTDVMKVGSNIAQGKPSGAPPWMKSLYSAFPATGAALLRAPGLITEAAIEIPAAVQRFATPGTKLDIPEGLSSNLPEWFTNPKISQKLDEIAKANSSMQQRYPEDNAWTLLQKGQYQDAANWLGYGFLENAPSMLMSGGAGYMRHIGNARKMGNVVLGIMGLTSAAQTRQATKDVMNPAASLAHASIFGALEVATEKMGSDAIMRGWANSLAKNYGRKGAKQLVGEVVKSTLANFTQEGAEEFVNTLGQAVTDDIFGAKDNPYANLDANLFNSFVLGGMGGMALGGAMSTKLAINQMNPQVKAEAFQNEYGASVEQVAAKMKRDSMVVHDITPVKGNAPSGTTFNQEEIVKFSDSAIQLEKILRGMNGTFNINRFPEDLKNNIKIGKTSAEPWQMVWISGDKESKVDRNYAQKRWEARAQNKDKDWTKLSALEQSKEVDQQGQIYGWGGGQTFTASQMAAQIYNNQDLFPKTGLTWTREDLSKVLKFHINGQEIPLSSGNINALSFYTNLTESLEELVKNGAIPSTQDKDIDQLQIQLGITVQADPHFNDYMTHKENTIFMRGLAASIYQHKITLAQGQELLSADILKDLVENYMNEDQLYKLAEIVKQNSSTSSPEQIRMIVDSIEKLRQEAVVRGGPKVKAKTAKNYFAPGGGEGGRVVLFHEPTDSLKPSNKGVGEGAVGAPRPVGSTNAGVPVVGTGEKTKASTIASNQDFAAAFAGTNRKPNYGKVVLDTTGKGALYEGDIPDKFDLNKPARQGAPISGTPKVNVNTMLDGIKIDMGSGTPITLKEWVNQEQPKYNADRFKKPIERDPQMHTSVTSIYAAWLSKLAMINPTLINELIRNVDHMQGYKNTIDAIKRLRAEKVKDMKLDQARVEAENRQQATLMANETMLEGDETRADLQKKLIEEHSARGRTKKEKIQSTMTSGFADIVLQEIGIIWPASKISEMTIDDIIRKAPQEILRSIHDRVKQEIILTDSELAFGNAGMNEVVDETLNEAKSFYDEQLAAILDMQNKGTIKEKEAQELTAEVNRIYEELISAKKVERLIKKRIRMVDGAYDTVTGEQLKLWEGGRKVYLHEEVGAPATPQGPARVQRAIQFNLSEQLWEIAQDKNPINRWYRRMMRNLPGGLTMFANEMRSLEGKSNYAKTLFSLKERDLKRIENIPLSPKVEPFIEKSFNEWGGKINVAGEIMSNVNRTSYAMIKWGMLTWCDSNGTWGFGIDPATKTSRLTAEDELFVDTFAQEHPDLVKIIIQEKNMFNAVHRMWMDIQNEGDRAREDYDAWNEKWLRGYFPMRAVKTQLETEEEWAHGQAGGVEGAVASWENEKKNLRIEDFINDVINERSLKQPLIPDLSFGRLVANRMASGYTRIEQLILIDALTTSMHPITQKPIMIIPGYNSEGIDFKELKKEFTIKGIHYTHQAPEVIRWLESMNNWPSGAQGGVYVTNDFARELEHIYKTSNVGKLVGMKLVGTSYGALSSAVKQFCLFLYPMAVMGDNLGAAMAQVGIPEVVGTGFQTSGDVFHNWLNRNDGVQRDSLARLTPEQRERYAIASGGFDMDLIRNMTDSLLKGPERELRGHPTVGEKIAETTGVVYDYLGSKAAWQMAQELGSQVWLKKVDELTKQFKGRFSQDVIDKMAADMSMSMMMMKQSWIMSKEASAIGAVALLATAYTVTGLRLLTGAIPALEIAMPFRSLKHQALNGEIRSAMAKHYAGHLATGLLGSYIFIFMMNMLLAGRPPWENEEGKRMKIAYNKDKNGKEMYLDFPFTRQFSSYVEMLPELIGNKIGLPYETSTMRWWTNKIAPIPRVMLGLMFGTDISGQKVRDPGATDWENLTNQAQWAIRNMAPRVGGPGGARGEWLTPEELWMPFVTGAMVSTSRTSDERQSTLGRQREEYLRTQSLRILGGYQPEDPRRQSKMQELMQQGSLSRSAARNMDRSRDRQTMRSLKRYNRNPNIVEFFKGKGHEE